MRYLLRDEDIHFQKGFLFGKSYLFPLIVSIPTNRIQHLEVVQGPIERNFGLSVLVLYTAGTLGSDSKIPGLTLVLAQQLKAQLFDKIKANETSVDEKL